MAINKTATIDACIFYRAPLRDLLMQMAVSGLFQAKWTEQIHQEWIRNLLQNRPDLQADRLERTKKRMNQAVRDCLVTDFESLIPKLTLPDPNDRHVLAAAIVSRSDVIVTYNLKDFPARVLSLHGIEAQHPDGFVADLFEQNPGAVMQAAETVRQRLRNPPRSLKEYLDTLEKQQLNDTVARLSAIM